MNMRAPVLAQTAIPRACASSLAPRRFIPSAPLAESRMQQALNPDCLLTAVCIMGAVYSGLRA